MWNASRTDNSDVPVYYESFSYAAENGEVDLYRISRQLNEECRNAIEEAIADNFDGMHLADDATKSVVEQFGMERMGYILAYTLNYNNHDGRYSHSNKENGQTQPARESVAAISAPTGSCAVTRLC